MWVDDKPVDDGYGYIRSIFTSLNVVLLIIDRHNHRFTETLIFQASSASVYHCEEIHFNPQFKYMDFMRLDVCTK